MSSGLKTLQRVPGGRVPRESILSLLNEGYTHCITHNMILTFYPTEQEYIADLKVYREALGHNEFGDVKVDGPYGPINEFNLIYYQ
jgi:hypothetical protein